MEFWRQIVAIYNFMSAWLDISVRKFSESNKSFSLINDSWVKCYKHVIYSEQCIYIGEETRTRTERTKNNNIKSTSAHDVSEQKRESESSNLFE